jgi:hypothetical protein
MFALAG